MVVSLGPQESRAVAGAALVLGLSPGMTQTAGRVEVSVSLVKT